MQFVSLIEHSNYEIGPWRFWIQYTGNENALVKLQTLIKTSGDYCKLELNFDLVSENEVDIIVKHGYKMYMKSENKVNGFFNIKELENDILEMSDFEEPIEVTLHNGNITKYFK